MAEAVEFSRRLREEPSPGTPAAKLPAFPPTRRKNNPVLSDLSLTTPKDAPVTHPTTLGFAVFVCICR